MILNAQGKTGSNLAALDALWAEIKANTVPPPNSRKSPAGVCGTFDNRICEPCAQHPFCWCTHPSALATTLSMHLGVADTVTGNPSEELITKLALASVDNGIAAAVAVHRGTHWVVVFGYDLSPAGTVARIYIRDPAHRDKYLVETAEWLHLFMTQIPCGALKEQFVVVGAGQALGPALSPRPVTNAAVTILSPVQIAARASAAAAWLLREHEGEWIEAFGGTVPKSPLFVTDPTNSGRDYYIIDFSKDGRPTGRIIVDARDESRTAYAGVERPHDSLPPFLTLEDVLHAAPGRELPPGDAVATARLEWQPCDQSHTPFLPFYRIVQDKTSACIRIDGFPFIEPTLSSAGA